MSNQLRKLNISSLLLRVEGVEVFTDFFCGVWLDGSDFVEGSTATSDTGFELLLAGCGMISELSGRAATKKSSGERLEVSREGW